MPLQHLETTNQKRIWLSPPHMSGRELHFVHEAFETNWIAPLGPNVDNFEKEIGKYIGEGVHVAALSSGTAALHLALILSGVGKDDIVFCQSLTFSASANPIIYQSAIPVFIDSEISTWNICPDALETAIKDLAKKGKVPKALILVHLYGMPAKMDEILSICQKYGITVIEDAAESLGSKYKGRQTGSFGAFSILSFNGNKIITTSGGGALLSESAENIAKAGFLATQARDEAPHYEHSQIGYNYRMSNVCAGIGRGQLEVISERVESRRMNFQYYSDSLRYLSGISFQTEPEGFFSNRWLTALTIDSKLADGLSVEKIRAKLQEENIESRPIWKPMHLQPVFKNAQYYGSNIAETLFLNGLCLPSGSSLSDDDLLRITQLILTGNK